MQCEHNYLMSTPQILLYVICYCTFYLIVCIWDCTSYMVLLLYIVLYLVKQLFVYCSQLCFVVQFCNVATQLQLFLYVTYIIHSKEEWLVQMVKSKLINQFCQQQMVTTKSDYARLTCTVCMKHQASGMGIRSIRYGYTYEVSGTSMYR